MRRTDGTALRLEFQLFDDAEGQSRAIADAMNEAQEQGISKAEFVRRALAFYVAHRTAMPTKAKSAQSGVDTIILEKLLELERKLEQQKAEPPAPSQRWSPPPTDDPIGDEMLSSSGLDMSRPRHRSAPRAPGRMQLEPQPTPQMDAEVARQRLVASIKGYGKEFHRGH